MFSYLFIYFFLFSFLNARAGGVWFSNLMSRMLLSLTAVSVTAQNLNRNNISTQYRCFRKWPKKGLSSRENKDVSKACFKQRKKASNSFIRTQIDLRHTFNFVICNVNETIYVCGLIQLSQEVNNLVAHSEYDPKNVTTKSYN